MTENSQPTRAAKLIALDWHFWMVGFMALGSVFGIALLSASIFTPPLLLTITLLVCIILGGVAGITIPGTGFHLPRIVAAIVLVATFVRSDIYPHLMGGQDQGLYTNFAELMLETGGLNFIDGFRAELPDSLRATYDRVRMASVPLIDPDVSRMTIAFYPLHPMWMAVMGWAFGGELKTLSLLVFSIICIWTGKLLTEEIFDSRRAGTIAALLLAINPTLIFFSKYPVTEIVGLAFSFSGFLYLIRGIKTKATKRKVAYLSLAILCFLSFFFVRMQFLIYLPFWLTLVIGMLLHDRGAHWRSGALPAMVLVGILFVGSLAWYYWFQRDLFGGMIGGHVRERLASSFPTRPAVVWGTAFGGLVAAGVCLHRGFCEHSRLKAATEWLLSKGGVWVVLALLASFFSFGEIYRTGELRPFGFPVDTSDPLLFRYHAIYRFMLFISPFGLMALVYGAVRPGFDRALPNLLVLFIATCWLVVLVQPWIPYLYYYGRYLAGEILPYSLLAVSGIVSIWIRHHKKKIAYATLILISIYSLIFYLPQFRVVESEPRGTFTQFAQFARGNDVVLAIGVDDRILVPLRLSYGKKIFAMKEWDGSTDFVTGQLPKLIELAAESGGRLLLLSPAELSVRFGVFLGGVTFTNSFISNTEHIRDGVIQSPRVWGKLLLPFYLVKRDSVWLFHDITSSEPDTLPHGGRCLDMLDFSMKGNIVMSNIQLTNFSHQEKAGRWTDGAEAAVECNLDKARNKIVIKARPYLPREGAVQKVVVTVNGEIHGEEELAQDEELSTITIPVKLNAGEHLKLGFHLEGATSPFESGESTDRRKLGIYVYSVAFE